MPSAGKLMDLMARASKYAPYRFHSLVYKLTGGKLGATTPGGKLKVLLLTTSGRKSGLHWSNPNNPAMLPAIMATYLGFVLCYVAWMGWTSYVLLSSKPSWATA